MNTPQPCWGKRNCAQLHVHSTAFAYARDVDPAQPGAMANAYRALVADQDRLAQIVTDVTTAHRQGANILVLTTWVDHLTAITDKLTAGLGEVLVLRGGMAARDRQAVTEAITARRASGSSLLIVGTGPYIGEGFDCPVLDTLFLATPVKFKGRLVQYVGRRAAKSRSGPPTRASTVRTLLASTSWI